MKIISVKYTIKREIMTNLDAIEKKYILTSKITEDLSKNSIDRIFAKSNTIKAKLKYKYHIYKLEKDLSIWDKRFSRFIA